jgi:basic membrane protein A
MRSKINLVFLLILSLFCSNTVFASELPKICMVLDKAGKDDHGFNQSTYNGFKLALEQNLISKESRVFEAKDDAQIQQATRSFVNSNCALIFAVGVNVAEPIKKLVNIYKNQKFVSIDYELNAPNVRSVLFREDQAGFLMGVIAGIKTKTKKVGLIAGMDIPLIERMKLGYEAGAHYIDPKIEVQSAFVSVNVDGWNNPSKAEEIALSQYNRGVDIIFQASGGSGIGIFDAAEKMDATKDPIKRYAIGCDSNQNWIKPNLILTSMIKRLDKTVIQSIQDLSKNQFTPGTIVFGLDNDGIAWAFDKNNQSLFTSVELNRIKKIEADIISGKVSVPDYYKIR